MPAVRIQDNMQLPANAYVVRVKEIEAGRGDSAPDMLLVMDPAATNRRCPASDTTEPAFGLPAMWVEPSASARRRCSAATPWSIRRP